MEIMHKGWNVGPAIRCQQPHLSVYLVPLLGLGGLGIQKATKLLSGSSKFRQIHPRSSSTTPHTRKHTTHIQYTQHTHTHTHTHTTHTHHTHTLIYGKLTVCIQKKLSPIDVHITAQGIGPSTHIEPILIGSIALNLPRAVICPKCQGRCQGEGEAPSCVDGGIPLPGVQGGRVALQGAGKSERPTYHRGTGVARRPDKWCRDGGPCRRVRGGGGGGGEKEKYSQTRLPN